MARARLVSALEVGHATANTATVLADQITIGRSVAVVRSGWRGAHLGWLALLLGCGDPSTQNAFGVSERGGDTEFRATWEYSSFELDVDLSLVTLESEDSCSSGASLVLNDVVSATERYTLAPTDCALLRLDEHGDIVMSEQPTFHDWTREELRVDKEGDVRDRTEDTGRPRTKP